MMRVLVLRPQYDAEQTARLLEMRGYEAIIAPVIEIEKLEVRAADYAFDAIIATSANAFRCLPNNFCDKTKPCFTVGSHTLDAGLKAGFSTITSASGDVNALINMLKIQLPVSAQLLYLAGQPRKPELEYAASQHGYRITVCETYKTNAMMALPNAAIVALYQGVDVILHFSKNSAQIAMMLFEHAGLMREAQSARHICLSSDVAEGLVGCPRIEIAKRPEQLAMLELI
jgi:uroporphyrinogen-III synthase